MPIPKKDPKKGDPKKPTPPHVDYVTLTFIEIGYCAPLPIELRRSQQRFVRNAHINIPEVIMPSIDNEIANPGGRNYECSNQYEVDGLNSDNHVHYTGPFSLILENDVTIKLTYQVPGPPDPPTSDNLENYAQILILDENNPDFSKLFPLNPIESVTSRNLYDTGLPTNTGFTWPTGDNVFFSDGEIYTQVNTENNQIIISDKDHPVSDRPGTVVIPILQPPDLNNFQVTIKFYDYLIHPEFGNMRLEGFYYRPNGLPGLIRTNTYQTPRRSDTYTYWWIVVYKIYKPTSAAVEVIKNMKQYSRIIGSMADGAQFIVTFNKAGVIIGIKPISGNNPRAKGTLNAKLTSSLISNMKSLIKNIEALEKLGRE